MRRNGALRQSARTVRRPHAATGWAVRRFQVQAGAVHGHAHTCGPSALLRGTAAWGRADPAAGTGLRRLPSHASPSQRRVRRDPHRPASSRSQALVYRCLGPGPWSRGCPSPAAPGPPEPASRLLWAGGRSSCAWGLGLGSCWVLAADTPPRGRSPGKDTRRRGRTGLVSEVTFAVFSSVEAAR